MSNTLNKTYPKLKVINGKAEENIKNKSLKKSVKSEKENILIFVGDNKFKLKKAIKLAKENGFKFLSYSEEEWATLEEIDNYIQEEELSKQVVTLPVGKGGLYSLDELEEETIKKVIKKVNGNMLKASRALKIARATLYRKLERYGLNLKKQREEQLKKQEKILKQAS